MITQTRKAGPARPASASASARASPAVVVVRHGPEVNGIFVGTSTLSAQQLYEAWTAGPGITPSPRAFAIYLKTLGFRSVGWQEINFSMLPPGYSSQEAL